MTYNVFSGTLNPTHSVALVIVIWTSWNTLTRFRTKNSTRNVACLLLHSRHRRECKTWVHILGLRLVLQTETLIICLLVSDSLFAFIYVILLTYKQQYTYLWSSHKSLWTLTVSWTWSQYVHLDSEWLDTTKQHQRCLTAPCYTSWRRLVYRRGVPGVLTGAQVKCTWCFD